MEAKDWPKCLKCSQGTLMDMETFPATSRYFRGAWVIPFLPLELAPTRSA